MVQLAFVRLNHRDEQRDCLLLRNPNAPKVLCNSLYIYGEREKKTDTQLELIRDKQSP